MSHELAGRHRKPPERGASNGLVQGAGWGGGRSGRVSKGEDTREVGGVRFSETETTANCFIGVCFGETAQHFEHQ